MSAATNTKVPRRGWPLFLRHAHWLLLILLLVDLSYSYVEHLNVTHDGDMVALVLPRYNIQKVLDDPLGLAALLKGEQYGGPNRYFAHAAIYFYLNWMPLFLQHFVDPIYSTYMACAIAKILIQGGLIALLAYYISTLSYLGPDDRSSGPGIAGRHSSSAPLLLAALLITPFFQTAGFQEQMGIIDRSITYCFFYSLPIALLLLYFLPFYRAVFAPLPRPISWVWHVALPPLAVMLALNGPIIPAVAGLMCLAVAVRLLTAPHAASAVRSWWHQPRARGVLLQLGFLLLCSAYSLYLGTFNIENTHEFTLAELYEKLWDGIPMEFKAEAGFPVLVFAVLANLLLIKAYPQSQATATILTVAWWLLVLSLIYVAALPLGGYRNYRPHIIRRDTLIPVTLVLLYLFGISTLYLLRHGPSRFNRLYVPVLVLMVAFYSFADVADLRDNNCEVRAMRALASSTQPIVHLEEDCSVMNWSTITDPNLSGEAAQLLVRWHVLREKKMFYH